MVLTRELICSATAINYRMLAISRKMLVQKSISSSVF